MSISVLRCGGEPGIGNIPVSQSLFCANYHEIFVVCGRCKDLGRYLRVKAREGCLFRFQVQQITVAF